MKLLQGNNLPLLQLMEENSVDTIITDPPYGLKFMSKKWDYSVPSVELWEECLRVLKPGGTLLCFAGSRTQHRMAVNVEDAGFILKDCIMWLYGSGFPKATDISKQLDKGHKRKVIGEKRTPDGKLMSARTPNSKDDYHPSHNVMSGATKHDIYITEPATPEAKLWNGWKSHGLKPAYEPILVAMKPNDGTYANNALTHGVSGLNIDGGRIGTEDNLNGGAYSGESGKRKATSFEIGQEAGKFEQPQGRFPANIILDEEAGKMLGEPSRFFYCAKASKKERGEANKHPTVKPIKLMEYLCTLTKTPTGGTVLDPFMGSGTTGLAAQNTGREFIGIEMDADYFRIANARIAANKKLI